MTTVTLTTGPSSATFEQVINDELFVSIGGAVQSSAKTGNRWRLVLTYLNLTSTRRKTMFGTTTAIRGRQNRLKVNMSTLQYSRGGAGGGTPLLVGAHSAGATSLSIDGASINITNWLIASDWITVGNQLCMVTSAVNTNGSGVATIPIWPELHKDYSDNAAVEISSPFGVFYQTDPVSMPIAPFPSDWLTESLILSLEQDVLA